MTFNHELDGGITIGVFIVAIIVIVGVVVLKNSNKDSQRRSFYETVSSSQATPNSDSKPRNTIEEQNLYSCVARFIGAISTIRDQCTWRSLTQHGYIEVMRDEVGTYIISGGYDHDNNYNVQNALQQGGYLDSLGMRCIEDGFSYQVNGFDPNHNSSLSIDDNRMYITGKYLVSSLQERFGSTINIKASWTRDNRASVSFEFREWNTMT